MSESSKCAVLWRVVVAALLGVGLSAAAAYATVAWLRNCGAQQTGLCGMLTKSPPWIVFTGLAAAPAVLLTWYWRTVQRNQDLAQRDRELTNRRKELAHRKEELALRRNELEQRDKELDHQRLQREKELGLQREQLEQTVEASRAQNEAGAASRELARETHLLGHFLRSIEAISSEAAAQQLAGVSLLEQLARDSSKYTRPCLDALAAFLKKHASAELMASSPNASPLIVESAIRAFAAVPKPDDYRGDLSGITLRVLTLQQADLRRVNLVSCSLHSVRFESCQLLDASLHNTELRECTIWECDCKGIDMSSIVASDLDLSYSSFQDAEFDYAKVDGFSMRSTFTGATFNEETRLTLDDEPLDFAANGMVKSRY